MATFSAQIADFVGSTEKALLAVKRGSAQEIAEQITKPIGKGGRMRVATGYLRASLMASTASMPRIDTGARPPADAQPGSFAPSDGQVSLVIAGADISDTIYLGFTASYAGFRENKDLFVETAALSWPAIVQAETTKVKAAFGL